MNIGKDRPFDLGLSTQSYPLNQSSKKEDIKDRINLLKKEIFEINHPQSETKLSLVSEIKRDQKVGYLATEELEINLKGIAFEGILEKFSREELLNEFALLLEDPSLTLSETSTIFFRILDIILSETKRIKSQNEVIPSAISQLKKEACSLRDQYYQKVDSQTKEYAEILKKEVFSLCKNLKEYNQAELDSISDERKKLAKAHLNTRHHIDPEMQKVYLDQFGPYVSLELKKEAAEKITNQLIALGSGLGIDEHGVDQLTEQDLEILELVKGYEKRKNKKIPLILQKIGKTPSIESGLIIESQEDQRGYFHKVNISQNEGGTWKAQIINGKTQEISTKTSAKTGPEGYVDISAWVHAYLDHKFYEEEGMHDELTRIALGLGVTAQTLSSFSDVFDPAFPKKLAETISAKSTYISGVSDPLSAAEIVGIGGDIVGMSLLIPSIIEAFKARKYQKELKKVEKVIQQKEKEISEHTEILKGFYQAEFGMSLTLTSNEDLKKLEQSCASRNKNTNVVAMLKEVSILQKIREESLPLKKQCKELRINISEKVVSSSTNALASLALGVKASMVLHHLIQDVSIVGTTAEVACSALAGFAAPLLIAGGAYKLVVDAKQMNELRSKKEALDKAITTLINAKNEKGETLVSETTHQLLKDIKKMESRNINHKIISTSLGITSDTFIMAAGAVTLAGVILGSSTMGVGVVAAPIGAGAMIAGKFAYDVGSKAYSDKKQRKYIKTQPEKSDIGKIARLNILLQDKKSPESQLVGECLVHQYYGFKPDMFLEVTGGLVTKYHDLIKKTHQGML